MNTPSMLRRFRTPRIDVMSATFSGSSDMMGLPPQAGRRGGNG